VVADGINRLVERWHADGVAQTRALVLPISADEGWEEAWGRAPGRPHSPPHTYHHCPTQHHTTTLQPPAQHHLPPPPGPTYLTPLPTYPQAWASRRRCTRRGLFSGGEEGRKRQWTVDSSIFSFCQSYRATQSAAMVASRKRKKDRPTRQRNAWQNCTGRRLCAVRLPLHPPATSTTYRLQYISRQAEHASPCYTHYLYATLHHLPLLLTRARLSHFSRARARAAGTPAFAVRTTTRGARSRGAAAHTPAPCQRLRAA